MCSSRDGKDYWCKQCRKEHYEQNKEAQLARVRARRALIPIVQDEIREYKAAKGCYFCPESTPCCLHFHHHADDKLGEVSNMVRLQYGRTKIWEEIAKCVVVCANCHSKLHEGLLSYTAPA
jgi:hypothetical protein